MVLDPIPHILPVYFFGSRPQPSTSPSTFKSSLGVSARAASITTEVIPEIAPVAVCCGVCCGVCFRMCSSLCCSVYCSVNWRHLHQHRGYPQNHLRIVRLVCPATSIHTCPHHTQTHADTHTHAYMQHAHTHILTQSPSFLSLFLRSASPFLSLIKHPHPLPSTPQHAHHL